MGEQARLGHHSGLGHTLAQHTPAWGLLDAGVVVALVGAAVGFAAAIWASRRRSPWPVGRTLAWYVGLVCAGVALTGPLATAARSSFSAHMIGHLLLGMLAPLLLALAAPVSLLLRALPVDHARTVSRVLTSPLLRVVTNPVVAGILNGGGLWALYTTDLYHLMHTSALLYAVVHLHIFVAGYIFTASIVGVDPDPHRASVQLRAVVLVLFIAAHSILAKWLYAHPPTGVEIDDARAGAQLMYYGGDVVDVTLIGLLLAGWYVATRPRVRPVEAIPPMRRGEARPACSGSLGRCSPTPRARARRAKSPGWRPSARPRPRS